MSVLKFFRDMLAIKGASEIFKHIFKSHHPHPDYNSDTHQSIFEEEEEEEFLTTRFNSNTDNYSRNIYDNDIDYLDTYDDDDDFNDDDDFDDDF